VLAATAALSQPTLPLVTALAGGDEPLRPAFAAHVLELDGDRLRLVDAVAGADEAALVGEHDELSAVADGELHHRSVDMRLDRER
jgi:hypothetical protein